MKNPNPIDVLNRLLRILHRSLPCYLDGLRPFVQACDERAVQATEALVADQRRYAALVVDAIRERDGAVEPGYFSPRFSAFNDLTFAYLIDRILEYQEADIATVEKCLQQLAGEPSLQTLTDEILGNARGHLENLREAAAAYKTAAAS